MDQIDLFISLKKLNKLIKPVHSKLEDIRATLNMISRKDYIGTLDFKDAYFIVPIHGKHRKY